MEYYKNKTIFIVGGSSGIGFALARELTKHDAKVCIFARDLQKLEKAKTTILSDNPNANIEYQILDVLDEKSIAEGFSEQINLLGLPQILINSAGFARPNYFENIQKDDFKSLIELNLIGARNIAFAILPYFKQAKLGHLINISSVAGFLGVFGYTDYCASKFALVGFSEALQQEVLKFNIKISVIYPPDTDTEGFAEEAKTKPLETQAISAGNALVSPEKLAKKVVKLLPKQKFHILPSLDSKITYYAKRYVPWLVNFIMMRTLKKFASENQENLKTKN